METSTPPMRGKICLITGATSGIGRVTAHRLAEMGAHVVLVGRDPARCGTAVQQIQAQTGNREVEALVADLSSQQQVRDLARRFQERHNRLNVLINNAGGMWLQRRLTVDGLELTFALNHLAYFLLTELLLDTLKASAPARIINVSSLAHRRGYGRMSFDDLMGERRYNGWKAYCQSKLANLLFTYELARRLEGTGVTANALHPGWVATGFAGGNGWRGRLWQGAANLFALSPEQGAKTIIYLASAPEVEGVSGRYFVRCREVVSAAASRDEEAARRLWQVSQELTSRVLTPS